MRTRGKYFARTSRPSKVVLDERRRHPNECPECEGFGTTRESRAVTQLRADGKLRTVSLGHGCLRCGGVGRVPELTCSRVH